MYKIHKTPPKSKADRKREREIAEMTQEGRFNGARQHPSGKYQSER